MSAMWRATRFGVWSYAKLTAALYALVSAALIDPIGVLFPLATVVHEGHAEVTACCTVGFLLFVAARPMVRCGAARIPGAPGPSPRRRFLGRGTARLDRRATPPNHGVRRGVPVLATVERERACDDNGWRRRTPYRCTMRAR